mgnify:CR=1 FL=1
MFFSPNNQQCAILSKILIYFFQITSNVVLTSKLTVEGPLRLKEEYVEGLLSSPTIQEAAVPPQVQSAYGQIASALQQLPTNVMDTLSNGVKIPLGELFDIMISRYFA